MAKAFYDPDNQNGPIPITNRQDVMDELVRLRLGSFFWNMFVKAAEQVGLDVGEGQC